MAPALLRPAVGACQDRLRMTGGRPRAILAGMVSQDPLHDASYWWSRAEEARTIAKMMRTVHPKNIMLDIAEGYERLAKTAEQRQRT